MGIDPGASGGVAIVYEMITPPKAFPMPETLRDIRDLFELLAPVTQFAYIEQVHSMPGQGVASTFKFGKGYGFLLGMLEAFNVPYDFVTPQKWQAALGCLTKGDKNVSKAKAQRLWPAVKFTHKTADATLIAEYCRRTWTPENKIENVMQGIAHVNWKDEWEEI